MNRFIVFSGCCSVAGLLQVVGKNGQFAQTRLQATPKDRVANGIQQHTTADGKLPVQAQIYVGVSLTKAELFLYS